MQDDRATKLKKERIYAESILKNAILLGGINEALRVRDELESILEASLTNAELLDALDETTYANYQESKKRIDVTDTIKAIFKGCSEAMIDTIAFMAEHDDLYILIGMYRCYNNLLEEYFKVTVVDVTTVVELDDHLREVIKNKLQNDLDAKVVLNEHIDKSIMGGVILSARNHTIDCSLARLLGKAKNQLTSVYYRG